MGMRATLELEWTASNAGKESEKKSSHNEETVAFQGLGGFRWKHDKSLKDLTPRRGPWRPTDDANLHRGESKIQPCIRE